MSRNDQIRRIEELDVALSTRLAQLSVSSRRPMTTINRNRYWLFPSVGVVAGFVLARIPGRRIVSGGISSAILLMRVQKVAVKFLKNFQ
jgi:hypothetical protein